MYINILKGLPSYKVLFKKPTTIPKEFFIFMYIN